MTNSTLVGWRTVTVVDVKNFSIEKPTGKKNFLKFVVNVAEGNQDNAYTASQLVEPTLIPGKNLYQWIRVCNISLSAIEHNINPALFRGKKLKARLAVNGDFYNITDIKTLDAN